MLWPQEDREPREEFIFVKTRCHKCGYPVQKELVALLVGDRWTTYCPECAKANDGSTKMWNSSPSI